jgi:hypothetical protein
MVEHESVKFAMEVQFFQFPPKTRDSANSRLTVSKTAHECSNHSSRAIFGDIAQLVEQRAENPRVKGSTPFVSTISEYSAVGSATALGAVGRWFESSYSDHIEVWCMPKLGA